MKPFIVFIAGSKKDEHHVLKICTHLPEGWTNWTKLVYASAHKEAAKLLDLIEEYKDYSGIIYVTIAGRSNALSGFMAGNTDKIVIACPPFADKVDMMVNINSTLQMPSNVPVLTILDPANCALAIQRIYNLFE